MQTIHLRAVALVKEFEGQSYLCPAGVPAIGCGHTATVMKTDVSRKRTITDAAASVNQLIKFSFTDLQRGVRARLVFSMGFGNFGSSTLLRLFNAGASDTGVTP